MFAPLIPITHWAKFYQLLHMEELATECQLRLYDQTNVYLKRCPKDSRLFVLSVCV